jgi:hypothetical protein
VSKLQSKAGRLTYDCRTRQSCLVGAPNTKPINEPLVPLTTARYSCGLMRFPAVGREAPVRTEPLPTKTGSLHSSESERILRNPTSTAEWHPRRPIQRLISVAIAVEAIGRKIDGRNL